MIPHSPDTPRIRKPISEWREGLLYFAVMIPAVLAGWFAITMLIRWAESWKQ